MTDRLTAGLNSLPDGFLEAATRMHGINSWELIDNPNKFMTVDGLLRLRDDPELALMILAKAWGCGK